MPDLRKEGKKKKKEESNSPKRGSPPGENTFTRREKGEE